MPVHAILPIKVKNSVSAKWVGIFILCINVLHFANFVSRRFLTDQEKHFFYYYCWCAIMTPFHNKSILYHELIIGETSSANHNRVKKGNIEGTFSRNFLEVTRVIQKRIWIQIAGKTFHPWFPITNFLRFLQ